MNAIHFNAKEYSIGKIEVVMTKYVIKCDDCKKTIKGTNDVRESYQGGRCEQCKTSN